LVNFIINKYQREHTAKSFLDLSKAVIIGFVIGGFIPNSPITIAHMIWAGVVSVILYAVGMIFLGGLKE
jgi:VIT1/CCC1 family predicted Fe2+/Mn2+ transporter